MKSHRSTKRVQAVAAFLLAILALTACQTSTPIPQDTELPANLPVPSATLGDLRSATPATVDDTETPEMPAADIQPTGAANAQQVLALAVADLSEQLDLPEESILIESVEAIQWTDASLGCPQPGMIYAQEITPGYLIVLAAHDRTYDYHTDQDQLVIFCVDEPTPQPSTTAGDSTLPIFVEIVQTPLSPDLYPSMPPSDTNPIGIYYYDPGVRTLLFSPAIQVLPTTEVLIGLSSATVPGKPYIASGLLQLPSVELMSIRVIAIDADTGALTLTYADQTFELGPGQSTSFKQGGGEEPTLLQITTITNYGRLEAIEPLLADPGSP